MAAHSQGGIVDWDGAGGETLAAKIAAEVGYPVQHLSYQEYIRGSMGTYVPETWGIPIVTIEMAQPGLTDGLFRGMLATVE
nr:murein peptide amidase A [Propionibacterium sp.]